MLLILQGSICSIQWAIRNIVVSQHLITCACVKQVIPSVTWKRKSSSSTWLTIFKSFKRRLSRFASYFRHQDTSWTVLEHFYRNLHLLNTKSCLVKHVLCIVFLYVLDKRFRFMLQRCRAINRRTCFKSANICNASTWYDCYYHKHCFPALNISTMTISSNWKLCI